MGLWDDERAQSIQVGAVLLFAVLIVAFSTYQAFVVPNQNREVEFNHNQDVREEMQELRNTVVSMHGVTSSRSVTVTLGTRYPSRLVSVNPGPPSGSIRTTGTTSDAVNFTIKNASATGETGDFWNGTARTYNTGGIAYRPNYNLITNAPTTVYENTVLYNQFRDGNTTAAEQALIDDEQIRIVAVNGSLARTQSTATSLDVTPVSTSEQTVSIENDTAGSNVTVTVPTRLRKAKWEAILEAERTGNGGHVRNISTTTIPDSPFRLLHIELEPGVKYQLRMSKVGVGTQVADEDRAYLTDVAGNSTRLDPEQSIDVTLQVRDAYNNPVSGVTVNASAEKGSLIPASETSDGDGEVTVTYNATGVSGGQWIDLNFSTDTDPTSSFDSTAERNVTISVRVQSQPSSSGGGGGVYQTDWVRPPYSAAITSENLSTGATRGVPFRMRTTDGGDPVSGVEVDYATNDSSVATAGRTTGRTGGSGYNETDIVWQRDGYVRAYATTDVDGDRVNATVDRILNESFEDPSETLAANGWYYNDSGNGGGAGIKDIGNGPGQADDGSRVAYINGSGASSGDRAVELNDSLNTTAYDALTVTYVAREPDTGATGTDNPDTPSSGSSWNTNENLRLQYRASDGSWVTADNVTSQTDGGEPISYVRRARIDGVANASHENFALRLRQGETTAADEWQFDSISVVGVATERRVSGLNQGPFAAYEYTPSNPEAADSITFDAARSDDPDGALTSYEWDWTSDGSYDATGRTATHTYSSAGDYNATLRVTDTGGGSNTTTQTISVSPPPSGFQSASGANLLPATSGQNQTITFTPDIDIPGNTDVTITLDDPQQTSPLQVDYQGSAGTSTGTISNKNANADTASVTWTAPASGVTDGTQVRVWVNSIKTGLDSQQTDPYNISITRTDSGATITPTFSVDQSAGTAELTNLQVEDLPPTTNGQTQTIRFEPTTDVAGGEQISISLIDAQGTDEVDYQNANPSANITTSDLSFTDQTADNASIRLTADSSGISAGQTVEITVDSVDTGNMNGAPYEVGFSRSDADTASTTFTALPAPTASINDIQDNSVDCSRNPAGNCDSGTSPTVEFDVNWSASDGNGDLQSVTVELIDPNGNLVDTQSYSYGGVGSASNTTTLVDDPGEWQGDYTVRVTASDPYNSDIVTQTETADGT